MDEMRIHDLALIAVKANIQSNFPAYRTDNGQQQLINDIAECYNQSFSQLKELFEKQD